MVTKKRVGVLALQGDFDKHAKRLHSLGAEAVEIRTPDDLESVNALIIPGGESTAMTKIMSDAMRSALTEFAAVKPTWGTCAGMIMLSKTEADRRVRPLGLMDLDVDRNGFGRQVHSFEADINVSPDVFPSAKSGNKNGTGDNAFHGIFIRAPRVKSHAKNVKELAWLGDEPVALRQDNLLVSSFHPELSDDDRFLRYFLSMI